MRMKRKDLLQAIDVVVPVTRDTYVKTLALMCFEGDTLRANDGGMEVVVDFKSDLYCCVDARRFHKIIESLTTDIIDIELVDSEIQDDELLGKLVIKSKGFKGSFDAVSPKFYHAGKVYPTEWSPFPNDIVDKLKLTRFSMSKDSAKPFICGAYMKKGFIESTDGYRGTRVPWKYDMPTPCIVHPALIEIMHTIPSLRQYCVRDGMMYMSNSDRTIKVASTLMTPMSEYPPTEKHYILTPHCKAFEFPEGLFEVLERACIVTERIFLLDKAVEMSVKDKVMTLRSQMTDLGEVVEELKIQDDVPDFQASINPVFFLEAFKLGIQSFIDTKCGYLIFKSDQLEHFMMVDGEEFESKEISPLDTDGQASTC